MNWLNLLWVVARASQCDDLCLGRLLQSYDRHMAFNDCCEGHEEHLCGLRCLEECKETLGAYALCWEQCSCELGPVGRVEVLETFPLTEYTGDMAMLDLDEPRAPQLPKMMTETQGKTREIVVKEERQEKAIEEGGGDWGLSLLSLLVLVGSVAVLLSRKKDTEVDHGYYYRL